MHPAEGRVPVTRTVALICARGGSKGLEGKNIKLLAGHPLIAYSVAQARECPFIEDVVVSTDSEEIAAVARRYGARTPFVRPAELASDTAPKLPVLRHALREFERGTDRAIDIVVDLDPTSPLRTIEEIAQCWALVQEPNTDVVFTVCVADKSPYFNMVELVDGYARLSKSPQVPYARRQEAPVVYSMNASVYAYRREFLIRADSVSGGRARMVVMPPERSHDIDRPIDFDFVEFLVRERHVTLPQPRPVAT